MNKRILHDNWLHSVDWYSQHSSMLYNEQYIRMRTLTTTKLNSILLWKKGAWRLQSYVGLASVPIRSLYVLNSHHQSWRVIGFTIVGGHEFVGVFISITETRPVNWIFTTMCKWFTVNTGIQFPLIHNTLE